MTYYTLKAPGATKVPEGPLHLAEEINSEEKDKLQKFFGDVQLGTFSEPCIVLDKYGRIVVWYLPDIVHPHRVVSPLDLLPLMTSEELHY